MLAACPHTFLRRCRAFVVAMLEPCEKVLELNHPGVGEHQSRVIARHKRAGGHDLVTLLGKVIQKC